MTGTEGEDDDDTDTEAPADPPLDAYPLSLDAILDLLAHHNRRYLLRHLQTSADDSVSFEEAVRHLLTQHASRRGEQPNRTELQVQLQHIHLPKLADAGVIEYDIRSETIRYRENDRLEAVLDRLAEFESD